VNKAPPSPRALGPVALLSLLVLLLFWYRPPARPRIAPPGAIPGVASSGWTYLSERVWPTPITFSAYQPIQRVQLDVVSAKGLYTAQEQRDLANEVEQALTYVSQRFGRGPAGAIQVYAGEEAGCNLNGLAYTDQRLVQVFTCASLPRHRAVNILAHEMVHQLAHDAYGDRHLQADMILAEGLATWGAGRYWLGQTPTFQQFVRENYQDSQDSGLLLPLATTYVGRSIDDMNRLYYQWASFVEYLIQSYGRNKFDALYVTGDGSPGSADYAGIYGKNLDTLEREWQAWLARKP
jgi:hypothetical protein